MNPELLGWCLILCQNSESQTCWEPPNSGWRKRWLTRQTAAMLSLLYSQSSFTGPPIPRVILLSHCTGHKRLRQLLKKIIFDNPMPMMITSTTWTDRLSKSSTCYIYKIHTLHQSASLLTCNYPVWPSSCIWPCIIKILLIIFLIYLICSNFLLWVHSSSTEQLHNYNYQKAELKKKRQNYLLLLILQRSNESLSQLTMAWSKTSAFSLNYFWHLSIRHPPPLHENIILMFKKSVSICFYTRFIPIFQTC